MQPKISLLERGIRHSALLVFCVMVSLALLSCGGSTTRNATPGTAVTSAAAPSGAGGTGGSGGSGGTGGTGGTAGTGGTGGTAGGTSGSSGSGSGGSGGSGGAGGSGTGGTGGSGSGGSGGTGGAGSGSTPVVIQSFSKPERLSGGDDENLIVDAKGNLNLAAAHKGGLDPLYIVNFLRLTPGATEVTTDTALPPYALNPQIAEDPSGNIFLSWLAAPSTSSNPAFQNGVFSRSNDGGATFSSPATPIFTPGSSIHMAVDSAGDIFVVWATANSGASPTIMFSRSTDGGKTFSAGIPLSDASKIAESPHIAVTPAGRIDVIWQYGNGQPCDSSNGFANCSPCDIWFTQSANGGSSFPTPVNVSHSSGCAGLDSNVFYRNEQQMQIDSTGNVNIVWDDSIAGVMFSRSTDGGSTFSLPVPVSASQGVFPKVAVDAGGNINVIWAPADASAAAVFSHSTDGGATFSLPMAMGVGGTPADDPQLAIDASGDIDVLWVELHEIRFSQSFDEGKDFSSPLSVATDTTDFSDVSPEIFPFTQVHMVVEANGSIDLAFSTDQFAGDQQVYLWFTHGATSSAAPPAPLFLSECCSDGTVGKSYTGDAIATGGTPSYSLTVTGLPPGLSLQNPAPGGGGTVWMILGTPTTAGTFAATFALTDSAGLSLKATLTITIAASSTTSASAITRSSP